MNLLLIIILGIIPALMALIVKSRSDLKKMRFSFATLSQSFEELDEQARLIVKTDIELHKTQEELDKRLAGLDALQKLSRAINTTLDENEIFNRLSFDCLNELGFEKYMFLVSSDDEKFSAKQLLNFSENDLDSVRSLLDAHVELMDHLRAGTTLSPFNLNAKDKAECVDILKTENFVLAPILTQGKLLGLTIAANLSPIYSLNEGDQEIITILTDQLGQAIENARLFEEVYRSRQDLELKIQERTRQLSQALENVQEMNKIKSQFISAVSHELRTPLTSIKGYASILIAGKIGDIPDPVKDRLEKINKHSDSLVALINNLLDISRIESGKADLKFKVQALPPIIDSVEDLLMPQLKEKDIIFQKHVPASFPDLFMDSSQVERIFINLISNAIKFTAPQGVITISAKTENEDQAVISVSDTGIGLKDEDAAKLFDEFYRVENEINQQVKGTGLGLSLVKKIVEAHHGTISVKSKLNEGTTFLFTLPTKELKKED